MCGANQTPRSSEHWVGIDSCMESCKEEVMAEMHEWMRKIHRFLKTNDALRLALGDLQYPTIGVVDQDSMSYDDALPYRIERCKKLQYYGERSQDDERRLTCALQQIVLISKTSDTVAVPVIELDGLNGSKSSGYSSLKDFAFRGLVEPDQYQGSLPISFATDDDFAKNIAHGWSSKVVRTVIHRLWDDKRFIAGYSDGSHHLAAIYRQCMTQQRHHTVWCTIEQHRIDPHHARVLSQEYFTLILHEVAVKAICNVLLRFNVALATAELDATPWLSLYTRPETNEQRRALLCLPQQQRKAYCVYDTLTSLLAPNQCFNVGAFVERLLVQQDSDPT